MAVRSALRAGRPLPPKSSSYPTNSFYKQHSKRNNFWEEVGQLLDYEELEAKKQKKKKQVHCCHQSGVNSKKQKLEKSGVGTEEMC
jgi:hypothetical protein